MDTTTTENLPALALPEGTALVALFKTENGLDPLIERIAAEVRAHKPDLTTAKGRDAIKSLAYKVARSKTMLDDAGKLLTDEQRKAISTVDAARRKMREALDALKDEARKPLDDWEAAEATRIQNLKNRLDRLTNAAPAEETEEAFAELIGRFEAVNPEDGTWGEYLMDAVRARDATLKRLRDAAELSRLRREAAARAEADRIAKERADAEEAERLEREAEVERQRQAEEAEAARQREQAEAAERNRKYRADRLVEYCDELGLGRIGGIVQSFGILIYELEKKVIEDKDACGDHWPRVDAARLKALGEVKDAQADAAAAESEKAQREKDEAAAAAAEKARTEAAEREADLQRRLDEQKAETERAAQAERDRLAEQDRAAREAEEKRAADVAHRSRIRKEMIAAIDAFAGAPVGMLIADAILDGKIPHVKAVL
ncbi:MAG: hypothetical protein KAY29_01315 [Brevundimonas sp.]|nr:hypothetical protein [Brevundimonas sp.]